MEEYYIEHCSDTTTKLLKGAAEAIAIVIAYTIDRQQDEGGNQHMGSTCR